MKKLIQYIFWGFNVKEEAVPVPVMKKTAPAKTPEAFEDRSMPGLRSGSNPSSVKSYSPERRKQNSAPCDY